MKERIKNIITILLVFGGLVLCAALIKYYLPSWVYYTFSGLFFSWIVWDSSKPEKKAKETYWYYTFVGYESSQIYGYGIQISDIGEFDFVSFYSKYPTYDLMMVKEISKRQHDELKELMDKSAKEEQSND